MDTIVRNNVIALVASLAGFLVVLLTLMAVGESRPLLVVVTRPAPSAQLTGRKRAASSASRPGARGSRPAAVSGGEKFFDPGRKMPYKSSNTSLHNTREEAVEALAKQFDRPMSWVRKNMGGSNDLATIHRNLNAARLKEGSRNEALSRMEKNLREYQRRRQNRNPGQPGYSLEQRKKAAEMTLIQKGYSPDEARKTVEAMVENGLLPDPPRK
jgi:hypothetical protein